MDARQRMRWTAGLATAIAIAGVGRVDAQQAGSTSATAGATAPTSAAPGAGSGFANSRAPQSAGFNPGIVSPFSPSLQRPLGGSTFDSFSGFSPFGTGFNPVGSFVGGVPTFADSRAPQSGFFNPAANVPFNNGFGSAIDGFSGTGGFLGGGTYFVAPNGYYYGGAPSGAYYDPSIGAVVVPVAVPYPVAVPVPATASAPIRRYPLRMREAGRPTSRTEIRSLEVARELMKRTALTEGSVVSADKQKVRVRVGTRVRTYPRSQVFFFASNGEMRSSSIQNGALARGSRVLVPEPMAASR